MLRLLHNEELTVWNLWRNLEAYSNGHVQRLSAIDYRLFRAASCDSWIVLGVSEPASRVEYAQKWTWLRLTPSLLNDPP